VPMAQFTEERRLRGRWFWIVSPWLVFALLNAAQTTVGMRAEGMHHAWTRLFFTLLLSWLVWMASTPVIVHLGRRFPPLWDQPRSTWLVHIAACVVITVLSAAWRAALQSVLHPWEPDIIYVSFVHAWAEIAWQSFYLSMILYAAVLAISYTLDSRQRLAQHETESARLNEQLLEARLELLRRQLEPHFLFNTLNGIAGLVRENRNETAVEMIAGLSDYLRQALDGSGRQIVSLAEEIDFLDRYFEIQKLRFSDRLQVSISVPKELSSAQVPSLILQPLAENAIQHGVEKQTETGHVLIAAQRNNGRLLLTIRNTTAKAVQWDQVRTGVGISNVKSRLHNLYGDAGDLKISNLENGEVEILISLPYALS